MRFSEFPFLSMAGGLLLTLSFPKVAFYPLAFWALVPALLEAAEKGFRRAFLAGLFLGLIHFATLLYWLVSVMVRFGGFPLLAALSVHFLLAFYLALYPALTFGFSESLGFLRAPSFLHGIGFALLWVLFETLRGHLFTGFPWEPLGGALAPNPYLLQLAAHLGTPFLSFMLAFLNYAFFAVAKYGKRSLRILILAVLLILLDLLYGFLVIPKRMPSFPFKVALVQGNIPQDIKWQKGHEIQSLEKYLKLSRQALACYPDLIVWPETAVPFFFPLDPLSRMLISGVKDLGVPVLFGAPRVEKEDGRYVMKNSLVALSPERKIFGVYDKEHLVPFGEYVPLERHFPWLRNLAVASGNYEPGRGSGVIEVAGKKLGVLICFENVFPELSRKRVSAGAEVLLVVTNDAWFGESAALPQHFYQSVLRAVETRRYVIQVSNTGLSGIIDPYGRVILLGPVNREWVGCFPDNFCPRSDNFCPKRN